MTGHRREGSARTGALGLHTDLYELRMTESYLRAGMTEPATFSLFVRPAVERPWFVALGVQRVLELLETFRFGDEELGYLREQGFRDETLDWLGDLEPSGEVWAVPDGTIVLANEPIVEVTAPMPVAQLLETAVMNLVQLSTLIATKAARIALAAKGRAVADFGFRRAHGLETGVEVALAAYVGGGLVTSNVEAGRRHGMPISGTMAHSFVQAYDSELEAFRDFASDHPDNSVLLVDTYDTLTGVGRAIEVADEMRERGEGLSGVRLDSGDLVELSKESRRLLDEAGHTDAKIFASGGLDERAIHELVEAGAPIDAFGVGTDLVVSKDRPAVDIAYKLVEHAGRPRAKYSEEKATLPGPKQIFRSGDPRSDVLACRDESADGERLLSVAWVDGEPKRDFDREAARERVASELDALPDEWKRPPYPDTPPTPRISDGLRALDEKVRAEHEGVDAGG